MEDDPTARDASRALEFMFGPRPTQCKTKKPVNRRQFPSHQAQSRNSRSAHVAIPGTMHYTSPMMTSAFNDVDTWIFDLDNTLYAPEARLFDQIEVRMTEWVVDALGVDSAEADEIRKRYWARFGTTLAGLMREHDVDPEAYLEYVHDISLDHLEPDPELADAITTLPGRAIVYTNGSEPYARRVIKARGLSGVFDAVYGVEHADYLPKPERVAFETIIARDGLVPQRAAMFEDDARNLLAPLALGMRTILVAGAPDDAPHVQHHAPDLAGFLKSLA